MVNPYTHFEVDVRFVRDGVLTVNGCRVGSFDMLTRSAWSSQEDDDDDDDNHNNSEAADVVMRTSPTPTPRTLHDLARFLRAELSSSGHNHWFPVAFNARDRMRHTFALRRYSALHAEEQYHELRLHTTTTTASDNDNDEKGDPMELDAQSPSSRSSKKRPNHIGGGQQAPAKRASAVATAAATKTASTRSPPAGRR